MQSFYLKQFMIEIGSKKIIAIEAGSLESNMLEASIWVAGRDISGEDKFHYIFALITAIEHDANNLIENTNYFKYDNIIKGEDIDERFKYILSDDLEDDLRGWHTLMEWGPPTSHMCCVLVPCYDKAYLCTGYRREGSISNISGMQIKIYDLICILLEIALKLKIIYNSSLPRGSDFLSFDV